MADQADPSHADRALDVKELIEGAPLQAVQLRVFALCALCMVMDGFDVQALGYVAPAIIQDWKIAPALLGPVFGASNLGVLVGQLSFTVLSDKIGRRPVLIAGTILFALLTLMTGMVNSVSQLLIMRFIAGTALGSIIPNATALVGEFTPAKVRIALLTYIGVGFTVGAAIGGFIAAWMIPAFGWRSVFYVGGIAPLILAAVMIVWLPESLPLLVLRGKKPEYVRAWLRRIDPRALITDTTTFVLREEAGRGVPIVHLFRHGRGIATILLWVVNFMNLFTVYSLANWLPTVIRGSGYDTSTAVLVGTTLQVGGTFAPFLMAWVIARKGFLPVLATTFAIACFAIALIGQPGLSLPMLLLVVFVAGACVVGAQPVLNALGATYYPTYLRSTGLGWGLGIGRAGSIVGPVLAGQFLAMQWTTQGIFLALAVPATICVVAVLLLRSAMAISTTDRSPDARPQPLP